MLPDQDFPEANFIFTAPEGMKECSDLKVHRTVLDYGGEKYPTIISKWVPSPEEVEKIKNGGAVYLYITGEGMPPVSVTAQNPFEL